MAGGSSIAAGPSECRGPARRPLRPRSDPGRRRRYLVAAGFLLPALVFLGVWVRLPDRVHGLSAASTTARGTSFVGIDNYKTLFTTDILLTAIKNNAIWVLVVPAAGHGHRPGLRRAHGAHPLVGRLQDGRVHADGDLTVRRRRDLAHHVHAGPDRRGTLNAAVRVVEGRGPSAGRAVRRRRRRRTSSRGRPRRASRCARRVQPGQVAVLGLTGIPPSDVPKGAAAGRRRRRRCRAPSPASSGATSSPAAASRARSSRARLGIPGVTVAAARRAAASRSPPRPRKPDGTFAFPSLRRARTGSTSRPRRSGSPFAGVPWLGREPHHPVDHHRLHLGVGRLRHGRDRRRSRLDPARRARGGPHRRRHRVAGVPARDRAAARAGALSVVFITMIINVLKVFDIVLSVAPASSQDDANVIALAMWRTSFGGVNDFGLGSAIAVFLFILVDPGAAAQRAPLPKGGLMATATGTHGRPARAAGRHVAEREGVGREHRPRAQRTRRSTSARRHRRSRG